jgi:two-component system OmpR family sensor kinase
VSPAARPAARDRDGARDHGAGADGAAALATGSLRARTVVAVLVLLALLLVALGVVVQATLGQRLRGQVEERLLDRASAAAALVGTLDADDLADRLSAQGLSVVIDDPDGGSVVAGPTPDELRAGPPAVGAELPPAPGRATAEAGPGSGEAGDASSTGSSAADATVTVASSSVSSDDEVTTLVSELSDGTTITLTTDSSSVGETLAQLRWVMLTASMAFLVLAAVGLVLVVRATLTPLDRMTRLARSIAAGDRGRRLRPARTGTEIGRVAVAFDEMLDGVEGAERAAVEATGVAVAAEQRMRSFVSDAAHELRTPVAGMRAAADTLVRSDVDADPEERQRLAAHVVREAERASRLVDDLLLMARVDRGLELELAPVDLEALAGEVVEVQRLRRPSLDLRVVRGGADGAGEAGRAGEPGRGSAVVAADSGRLAQVLGNLLDNAARATGGRGHVVVTIDVDDPHAVALTVVDDGPGVPAADRERVFDRLVRLDPARRTGDGGAGLGLPIARGVARAHGGDLVLAGPARADGSGAAFRLTVPRRPSRPA